jgi:hypothetical protein
VRRDGPWLVQQVAGVEAAPPAHERVAPIRDHRKRIVEENLDAKVVSARASVMRWPCGSR